VNQTTLLEALRTLSVTRRRSEPPKGSGNDVIVYGALQRLLVDFPRTQFLTADAAEVLEPLIEISGEPQDTHEQRIDAMLHAAVQAAVPGLRTHWRDLIFPEDARGSSMKSRLGATESDYRSRLAREVHGLATLFLRILEDAGLSRAEIATDVEVVQLAGERQDGYGRNRTSQGLPITVDTLSETADPKLMPSITTSAANESLGVSERSADLSEVVRSDNSADWASEIGEQAASRSNHRKTARLALVGVGVGIAAAALVSVLAATATWPFGSTPSGNRPGARQSSSSLVFEKITAHVRLAGQPAAAWATSARIPAGDPVEWDIQLVNTVGEIDNTIVTDQIPQGVVVVPGSLRLYNGKYPTGQPLPTSSFQSEGSQIRLNIGDYLPLSDRAAANGQLTAQIIFSTEFASRSPNNCARRVITNKAWIGTIQYPMERPASASAEVSC